jgi:hypothetical protein
MPRRLKAMIARLASLSHLGRVGLVDMFVPFTQLCFCLARRLSGDNLFAQALRPGKFELPLLADQIPP